MKYTLQMIIYYTLRTGRLAVTGTLWCLTTLLGVCAVIGGVLNTVRDTVLEWEPKRPVRVYTADDEYTNPDNYGV